MVVRIGGDELVVMLCELDTDKTQSASHAKRIAEKVRLAVSEPYWLTLNKEGQAESTVGHNCSASTGVVLFANHETSQEYILGQADATMYQAKYAGRNRVQFYEEEARPSSSLRAA